MASPSAFDMSAYIRPAAMPRIARRENRANEITAHCNLVDVMIWLFISFTCEMNSKAKWFASANSTDDSFEPLCELFRHAKFSIAER